MMRFPNRAFIPEYKQSVWECHGFEKANSIATNVVELALYLVIGDRQVMGVFYVESL